MAIWSDILRRDIPGSQSLIIFSYWIVLKFPDKIQGSVSKRDANIRFINKPNHLSNRGKK